MNADDAKKRFELENNIKEENIDEIFRYDEEQYTALLQQQPWKSDETYFQKVKISAIALVKMAMHARSGGDLEVMGLMQGRVEGDTMIVVDAFALPVEGTETRVNAQTEAYEYMSQYFNLIDQVGKKEKAIGWYHSHPGYGCWLSGIDVSTQMLNQKYQEPWLAVVIDPKRTISSGKVEIAAFRTYSEGYKPPNEPTSEYQPIPLDKIEDFGVHCKQYYPLETSFFKSNLDSAMLDLLWNKYWVNTLSSSPIFLNRDYTSGQIMDLAEKLKQCEGQLLYASRSMRMLPTDQDKTKESQMARLTKDSVKTTMEQVHGLMAQVLKDYLFNNINKTRPDDMEIDPVS